MQGRKLQNLIHLVVIFLVTAISYYLVFIKEPISKSVKLGLDLQSGTHLLLELQPPAGTALKPEDVDRVLDVLRKRTDEFGTTEPIIQKSGSNRIIVDIPSETNTKRAEEIVTRNAFLEFKELSVNPATKQEEWKTVLTGAALVKALPVPASTGGANAGEYQVKFTMTKEGAREFAKITERNLKKPIAIYLDGKQESAPTVQSVIPDGEGVITGSYTADQATDLARLLQAGALPIPLKVVEAQTVSATLGKEALIKSIWAGLIGLTMVIIFMMVFYRLPGMLANIALVVYAIIVMAFIVLTKSTLTLPGIAGFILSIGMAVDANILIFERLKEELWSGKSINQSVETAFKRAWSSIFDSHVTTVIGAWALYQFGSSSVKGFGFTLAFGTIFSFITAIYITRALANFFLHNDLAVNRKLFGE